MPFTLWSHFPVVHDGASFRTDGIWSELHGDSRGIRFFQAISLTISASLRSANKAVYPMMVTVVVNILNIIGNYSLILVSSVCRLWEWKVLLFLLHLPEGYLW